MKHNARFLVGVVTDAGEARMGLQTDDGVFALNGSIGSLAAILETEVKSLMDKVMRSVGEQVAAPPTALQLPDSVQVWSVEQDAASPRRERPYLFRKAMGFEVVEQGAPVGIRFDAANSVAQAGLMVVLNSKAEVIGFALGVDVVARDIAAADPLYLPQAKVYYGACALGERIWLQPGAADYPNITIQMTVRRGDETVYTGQSQTRDIGCPLPVLRDYLGRCQPLPYGALLFVSAGEQPPTDFSLQSGDVITVTADPIGTLQNPVRLVNNMRF